MGPRKQKTDQKKLNPVEEEADTKSIASKVIESWPTQPQPTQLEGWKAAKEQKAPEEPDNTEAESGVGDYTIST